jgi:monovalent cation:H+ antiporter-2, CPA2 family
LNANLRILVRARYLGERADLEQAGATAAVFEEGEAAVALARLALAETGASREVVERSIRDLRLRLILDNVSNLAVQTVRRVMVPWTRVHRLSRALSLQEVLRQISHRHYSRWPAVDAMTDSPVGYLLTKDLVAEASTATDWTKLVRPLHFVGPDASIAATLLELQRDGTTVCIVADAGRPIGLITIEDILEQVVGRMEDEYPRGPRILLRDAVESGGIVLDLAARTPEEAITELAAAIRPGLMPSGTDVAQLALDREKEVSTDVGAGVAIPHARCPNLRHPLVVFGLSAEGIPFNVRSSEPVRLILLLVTPTDRPDLQVLLLGRIASLVTEPSVREGLCRATSAAEVLAIIGDAESAGSGTRPLG